MFNCREELAESHLHVSYFQWEYFIPQSGISGFLVCQICYLVFLTDFSYLQFFLGICALWCAVFEEGTFNMKYLVVRQWQWKEGVR